MILSIALTIKMSSAAAKKKYNKQFLTIKKNKVAGYFRKKKVYKKK